MMEKNIKISLFLLLISFFIFNCSTTKTITKDKKEKVSAVCMWKAVSLKEAPNSKGKYITTIYLGEVATTNNEIVTDSSTPKVSDYVKITLRDGTEGWTLKSTIAIDAKSCVIESKTKIYNRPDILTAGKKEFDRMQFIVVYEKQGDWVKVKGKRKEDGWFTEGWVKSSHITDSKSDINVAVLTVRAFNNTDKNKKIKALKEIIENSDLAGSQFIYDLKEIVENLEMESLEE